MAGFANSPFAVTPFGAGTPATAPIPPQNPIVGARFINPRTRDYELASDGSFRRMPIVRQRVILAVSTVQGSSAAEPRRGRKATDGLMGTDFEQSLRESIQRAVQEIVDDGSMRLESVQVERGNFGRFLATIAYTDLTTGQEDSATTTI